MFMCVCVYWYIVHVCRWGFVQFSEDTVNSTSFKYDADQWAVYTSLVQTYYAMKVPTVAIADLFGYHITAALHLYTY